MEAGQAGMVGQHAKIVMIIDQEIELV